MTLTQDEVDACREAFQTFDLDKSGTIDATELRSVLTTMGQEPTDEELFQMIAEARVPVWLLLARRLEFSEYWHCVCRSAITIAAATLISTSSSI